MEPEGSLPCSQETANGPSLEPDFISLKYNFSRSSITVETVTLDHTITTMTCITLQQWLDTIVVIVILVVVLLTPSPVMWRKENLWHFKVGLYQKNTFPLL
jgi:hypothetical protein